jgi:hypothetical protein
MLLMLGVGKEAEGRGVSVGQSLRRRFQSDLLYS